MTRYKFCLETSLMIRLRSGDYSNKTEFYYRIKGFFICGNQLCLALSFTAPAQLDASRKFSSRTSYVHASVSLISSHLLIDNLMKKSGITCRCQQTILPELPTDLSFDILFPNYKTNTTKFAARIDNSTRSDPQNYSEISNRSTGEII